MLTAQRSAMFRSGWAVQLDGRDLTELETGFWKRETAFELDGERYSVGAGLFGRKFAMKDAAGEEVAHAERVGRKSWAVTTADSTTHEFERESAFRSDQVLIEDGEQVGAIRRQGSFKRSLEVDLPTLPLPLQLFALTALLMMWQRQAAGNAAAGSAAAASASG